VDRSGEGDSRVHTQGRNIAQARRLVREALSLFADDVARVELVDDIRLGPELRKAMRQMAAARAAATRQQQIASQLSKKVAKKLVARMSVRDAGEVPGISFPRAQQLASA
jgi:hypothetical protein